MNNLKSYTEYAVTTPTTDFVIGFDFNYGTDAVNVTVDGVPATEAEYSVIYLNSTTMRLSPAVPTGVVRLQRETDIDVPDNQFTAGAKFIASNMDENFTQIRHAQQEVRDGFSKLSDDTYEIIDTLQVVGQAAQDAADAAEQAAQTANDAAAQVNDKVSYQDLDNAIAATPHNNFPDRDVAGAHPASAILDASGEDQQQLNNKSSVKHAEFVTVQDFYSNKTQAYQGTTTLASALYASLSQLKGDYPFADSLDWSVDALALQAFFNKLQNTRVIKAVCSGEFFSSKPLALKAELTKTLEFNAVLKPISGFGGGDLLTIRTSRHLQMIGGLELWGAVGASAGITWANRLWNNGMYIIDSTRMTNTLKITPRYFKGWGVLAYSSTYDTVSTNNNMTSFGNIQAQLNGSKAGQWQTTFTNKVNTGSASSTGQRSTLTLSTPVNDVSLVDSNIIYNGELYLITDHSGAQITVFPWLSTTNTSGSIDIIYGGGVKSSGADSNCVCFDMIDASDNAVGAHVRAFLGSIVNRFVGQFNTIGSQHGNGVINTALYGTWINPYYEGNMFDMYSTSYAPNSDLMLNPNALNLGKCVQLQPRKADLTLDENISRFQNSMYLDGQWYTNQNNRPDGTSPSATTLTLGDQKKVIRSNTATINLKDDADKRRLWGYTDIEFEIIGNAVNNGTSGVSTIKCDVGYTINGSSSDLVVQPSNSAFRILARLINGSAWSISIFYAAKPSASKTYDPPSLAAGAQQSTTVTVSGATLGNMVVCSFSVPLSGTRMWAEVTAANTVTVYHRNDTGAVVDVPSGTLTVKVI